MTPQHAPAVAPISTLRLLLVLAYVLAAHASHLPLWIDLLVGTLLLWRTGVAMRGWVAIPRIFRLLLAGLAVLGVILTYGRINGQHAGLGLLVVMLGAKLTELNTRRDHRVIVFFAYFVLATHFLFSQKLAMVPYAGLGALALTMLLVDLSHPSAPLPIGTLFRTAGHALLYAIPLMLIMFILFPRIPGPIWGLPSDAGAARSGLSDSMHPGAISSLALSDAVAFRVHFDGPVPPPRDRYWRGPVFWHFDGEDWTPGALSKKLPHASIEPRNGAKRYRYRITLEPNRQHWLFALEHPVIWPTIDSLDGSGTLRSRAAIKQRQRYTLVSEPAARLGSQLSPRRRKLALQLPRHGNPRARALAQHWRQQGLHSMGLVRAALQYLRGHDFVYTLHPPLTGRNGIDDFLFHTHKGFCEHYASAFTFLMRAAGLPARVVTGYLGGEESIDHSYLIIRQSDAHAWSEVWLPEHGWTRIDPTAVVVPERLHASLATVLIDEGQTLATGLRIRSEPFLQGLQLRLDWINNAWNQFVLGYGPQLQNQFLSRFGLNDITRMIIALTLICAVLLALSGLLLLRPMARRDHDPVQRAWLRLGRRLARAGLARRASEGPRDYLARSARYWPEQNAALQQIRDDYLTLRYADITDNAQFRERSRRFIRMARGLHPSRRN